MLEVRELRDEIPAFADVLVGLLDQHAEEVGAPFNVTVLAFEARRDDAFLGGVRGGLLYDWLYIKYLAVEPAARGMGVGTKLMAAIEQEARRRGATDACVDTFGFQAAPFYERLGYAEFGRLTSADPRTTRSYFAKRLPSKPPTSEPTL